LRYVVNAEAKSGRIRRQGKESGGFRRKNSHKKMKKYLAVCFHKVCVKITPTVHKFSKNGNMV